MAAPPEYEQLSESSKRALEFAWAAALVRTDGAPDVQVEALDLLIGIMLAHPGTSEAELTFRHFDLVAGQALAAAYPGVNPDDLAQRHAEVPRGVPPPSDSEVGAIIERAVGLRSSSADRHSDLVTELRYLWVSLLGTRNRAAAAIFELLAGRGVDAVGLAARSEEWVTSASGDAYSSVLQRFAATPVDVVNFKADQSSRRSAQAAEPGRLDDYVGISAEVDAFAYLLASRTLEPPLAVGLFGEWGSGKSFFLESIKGRINQLIKSPSVLGADQRETPFWKHIVQVDFNAWHYIEGDLWSSLVDNLFRQLNVATDDTSTNVVEERRAYLLEQLEQKEAGVALLAGKQAELERNLANYKDAARLLADEKRAAEQQLEAQRHEQEAAALARQSSAQVMQALANVNVASPDQPLTLGQAAESIKEARAELDRAWGGLRAFSGDPKWLVVVLASLVLVPVVALLVSQYAPIAVAWVIGAAPVVVAVVKTLQVATTWLRERRRQLDAARSTVDADIQRQKDALQAKVATAQQAVDATQHALHQAEEKHAEALKDLASVHEKLLKAPPAVLNEFLRARLDAGEYRKRLGLPAIIRDDFKDLAELIGYQNDYLLDPAATRARAGPDMKLLEPGDAKLLNRIILYIDDLDRCPDSKVIEVLQAVHLLLAFPLFVVVVAVDARWLAHALQTRYPALAGGARTGGDRPARPEDYLEKIFQIPFWVRPLDLHGRASIVRGLLGEHVREDALVAPRGPSNGHRVLGQAELDVLTRMVAPRTAPPRLDVSALQVTREELQFLERLTPLLGDTPRSVKRFVNLYQLIKILRRSRSVAQASPPDEYVAAFLLAVAESSPRVFERFEGGAGTAGLEKLADAEIVRAWLDAQPPEWQQIPGARMVELAQEVKRFLFRVDQAAATDGTRSLLPHLVHVIQDR